MNAATVIQEIEKLAPPGLALPDDPVGLQCGDPGRTIASVMLALDGSARTINQAVKAGAHMLITHHPLFFAPVTSIDTSTPLGRALSLALATDLVVYSAHTNLDASPVGVNASVAEAVGIVDRSPLVDTAATSRLKVVTFVPAHAAERVREAVFSAGAGRVGAYTRCSFTSVGEGTFFGESGTRPTSGRSGNFEKLAEQRLEVVVDPSGLEGVRNAIIKTHPYEEAAIDVYQLVADPSQIGLGLVGRMEKPVSASELASRLARRFGTPGIRIVGSKTVKAKHIAVCTGSGASLLGEAARRGARLYITGDMKYHDARLAQELGVVVLDVGHYPAERYGFMEFGRLLEEKLKERGFKPRFISASEKDPFTTTW